MKFNTFILTLFIVFSACVQAAVSDSLIRFKDLECNNETERNVLASFARDRRSVNLLDLFMVNYVSGESCNKETARDRINELLTYLKRETKGMEQAKAVKWIYKEVHKKFFKVYKMENSLCDVFSKGEFNCVSGTAIYVLVFKELGIPYQIMEAPQHVYLVAYPSSHKIVLETTTPENGYFVFTEAYVTKYNKYLLESKLITQQEFETSSSSNLFNKYYFSEQGLSNEDLIAIQYSNFASYYLNQNENQKALEQIKKACFIRPNERNNYFLRVVLESVVLNCEYKTQKDVDNLALLCRYNAIDKREISNERIYYEFGRLMREQLINNSEYSTFEKSYNLLSLAISDTSLSDQLAFAYHYELARIGYNNLADRQTEMLHLKEAGKRKPRHAELQNLVLLYMHRLIDRNNNPTQVMDLLDEFTSDFAFLNANEAVHIIRTNCYLELTYEYTMQNKIEKAEKHLAQFEQLCQNQPKFQTDDRYVEKAYSSVAMYYYKRGNTNKTREVLKRGLTYAPENFGLKIRLSQAK